MVLNIIVTEGMASSLNNSRNLALRPNLLLPTKCNATTALKANHFRQLGVTMRNLKTITDVIVLTYPDEQFLDIAENDTSVRSIVKGTHTLPLAPPHNSLI